MSRLIVTLLMHWQITCLIILPLLSAQMTLHVRKKAEKQTLKVSSDNAEVYNMPFSMEELQNALRRAHATSGGPDE